MKNSNSLLTLLLIICFPIGIVYCIGKNLFNGNFASFIGAILIFGAGFCLAVWLLRPDISQTVIDFLGFNMK